MIFARGELDAQTGIGSSGHGADLDLGVGEAEPVGVDHDARRADDDQYAVHHVRVDPQDARGDHRVGEVEGDPAQLGAEFDARGYRPASLPYVPAAVLLDHEYLSLATGAAGREAVSPASSPSVRAVSAISSRVSSSSAVSRPSPPAIRRASTTRWRSSCDARRPGPSSGMAATQQGETSSG